MSKIIQKFDPDVIKRAVDRIADPVIQTLTPLGNNVLFEKDLFVLSTNDGANIAKLIDSEDEVEDAIIQMVKYGSLATNTAAGDGTSSTILYIKKAIYMGLESIAGGMKPMLFKRYLNDLKDKILANAEKLKKDATRDDWYKIAYVASSGDDTIATNVVDIIDTAGLDGMIFLNESKNRETKITKDTGYNLDGPMFDPVLGNLSLGRADYQHPSVFVTDKKLYHVEECREILESAYKNGIRDLVIVARDFLGDSAEFLIANHTNAEVPLNILLIKYQVPDKDFTPLYDLATYLGGHVVEEKGGNLKDRLTAEDYIAVERVYSSGPKTIFVTSNPDNESLSQLVSEIDKDLQDKPEDEELLKRKASLTAGTVNVQIGAATGPELREIIFRYEDAVSAVRAAIRSGYVVGGGVTLYNSTRDIDDFASEFGKVAIKQIAANCGVTFDESKYHDSFGYNAAKDKYSDLEKDGLIEPYDVLKHSITNAFSIVEHILTSGYIIVNKIEKKDE